MSAFNDKVILITGASGGIGRAMCRHFTTLGAKHLIALDRVAEVHELAGERTVCVVADISDAAALGDAIRRVSEPLGAVDVLINNAAIASADTLAATTVENWHRDIDIDLNGTYHCTRAVLPMMQRQGRGAIVTISSVNALTALGNPAYSAAKAGLISLTRSVAVEYGRYGIRANCICPGTVKTPVWQARVARQPAIFEQLKKWYPLGQVAEPVDIAKAAAFLASEDARMISGAVLNVDGGLMAGNALLAGELTLEDF